MLQTQFVPVAIDQAYQRRQKDTEGDFYRKIAGKSPRGDGSNGGTTQGLYVAAPDGTYLGFSNHRDPERITRMLNESLARFQPKATRSIRAEKVDARFNPTPPPGGMIVRVQAKVLSGYEPTDNHWRKIFQSAVSRDNLWITAEESAAIAQGKIPEIVQRRIAKYHLVDNTRGEPPMWRKSEIKNIELKIENGVITGSARMETRDQSRGFEVNFFGKMDVKDQKVTRFELVAKGLFWGEGRYTRNAPKGKFPLLVVFRLADGSDVADAIPPQGSRGWVRGYLEDN